MYTLNGGAGVTVIGYDLGAEPMDIGVWMTNNAERFAVAFAADSGDTGQRRGRC
jgi:hypothetical protein